MKRLSIDLGELRAADARAGECGAEHVSRCGARTLVCNLDEGHEGPHGRRQARELAPFVRWGEMGKNDISMGYRVFGGVGERRSAVIRRILDAIDSGMQPPGLRVVWKWRNNPDQDLREADFDAAIAESRAGFITLMRRRLERDLARALEAEAMGEAAVVVGEGEDERRSVDDGRGAPGDRGRAPDGQRRAGRRTVARGTRAPARMGRRSTRGAAGRGSGRAPGAAKRGGAARRRRGGAKKQR